jgi:hypothetical protein
VPIMRFEMIFVILAGVFLGTLILNENRNNLNAADTLYDTQYGINAVSIANSYVEKISNPLLAFDEYLISNAAQPTGADSIAKLPLLSSVMVRESGEYYQYQYDDVDDYNGLDTMVVVSGLGNFHVRISVRYFDPVYLVPVTDHQWCKQVTITVTDTIPQTPSRHYLQFNGIQSAVTKQFIVSYYKFLQ